MAQALRVCAEAHSDDYVIRLGFDATPWFEQARDDEIAALCGCGWGGDYEADEVARFFSTTETKQLFDYLAFDPKMVTGDTVGFECHVDPDEAMAWIRQHRPLCHRALHLSVWAPAEDLGDCNRLHPCGVRTAERGDDDAVQAGRPGRCDLPWGEPHGEALQELPLDRRGGG